jgi:hypothetical protein
MKSIQFIIILALVTSLAFSQEQLNPTFEFSGIDNFWEIVDALKEEKDPSQAQWDKLFQTPGYAVLIKREFAREKLQQFITTAYKPSLQNKKAEIISKSKEIKGWFWKWFTPSYYQALEYSDANRAKIISKRDSFKTFPYTRMAIEELLKYLPEKEVSDPPQVSFIVFNDSRGYTPVVMGLNDLVIGDEALTDAQVAALKSQGFTRYRPQVLYFAHEFFHHYRDQKLEFRQPENNKVDESLIWYINQIENEGIADLINVAPLYNLAIPKYKERIDKEQALVPAQIKGLSDVLAEIHSKPETAGKSVKNLGKYVKRSGHPIGYYMASLIQKYEGREALVKVVRNPFKFFYLYNQVCKDHGEGIPFSQQAIALIKSLDAKYSLNN